MDTILSHISVHTKVRRLAYVKFIVESFFERDYYETNFFPVYLEKVYGSEAHKKFLKEYKKVHKKDDRGEITNSGKGNSSFPYIRFSERISFIYNKNYAFSLSKYGKVYKALLKQLHKEDDNNSNPFVLSEFDKFIFLKQILNFDFLYFINLLKTIYLHPNSKVTGTLQDSTVSTKFPVIKANFVDTLSDFLINFKNKNFSFKLRKKINDLLRDSKEEFSTKRIRKFEGIIEPRMGWLIDLDFIDSDLYNKGKICLSKSGKKCLDNFEREVDIIKFFEKKWLKTFISIYAIDLLNEEASRETLIIQYLKESFVEFKTMMPNRVTVSQAINYTSYKLFFINELIVEYDEIKKFIFDNERKIFDIDWFTSENDGSLKLI